MITTLQELSQRIGLDLIDKMSSNEFSNFPLLAPESYVSCIKPKNGNDPLLLQILPQKCELKNARGFNLDPLGEKKCSPIQGLIHKYYGRVLLLVTDICAINCRFCFRRHQREKVIDWSKAFSYIRLDPTISEVILSGGDPLMLAPKELRNIIARLENIPRIKRIRIHSRVPVVMPERLKAYRFQSKLPLVMVIHCNHPNEISSVVERAIKLLQKQNITVFNQSVLLRNINDDPSTLIALNEKLFAIGVTPYYLHTLDKVKGAAHFYVGIKEARKIYKEMHAKLPGYLVPKLVVEFKNRKRLM